LGGWQSGKRQDKQYVTELANLPSKAELVSKLLFLLQYPIKTVAYTLSQVAEKK
jgi:large subunit ribosomal protein L10